MPTVIDGHEYITSNEFAEEYGRDPSGLRHAARADRYGIGSTAIKFDSRTKLYRADLVERWRTEQVDTGDWARSKPEGDVSRIARRYDLDYGMVQRAAKSGRLRARQRPNGEWVISDTNAAAWAAEWLGITAPVEPAPV